MNLNIQCFYCGKKWSKTLYYYESTKDLKCPDCNDKNLIIKENKPEDNDPFGYNHRNKKNVSKT